MQGWLKGRFRSNSVEPENRTPWRPVVSHGYNLGLMQVRFICAAIDHARLAIIAKEPNEDI